MRTVLERVKEVIAHHFAATKVDDTTKLTADLGADSLDDVELLVALEDEFQVEIPDAVAHHFRDNTPVYIANSISCLLSSKAQTVA